MRGITVRSRSVVGNFAGGIQSLFGGKLTVLRQPRRDRPPGGPRPPRRQHATEHGANAIIAMRYDANEIMEGITEVLAYGTGVVVEAL